MPDFHLKVVDPTLEVADPKSEVGKLRSGATSYLTPGITQGTVAV